MSEGWRRSTGAFTRLKAPSPTVGVQSRPQRDVHRAAALRPRGYATAIGNGAVWLHRAKQQPSNKSSQVPIGAGRPLEDRWAAVGAYYRPLTPSHPQAIRLAPTPHSPFAGTQRPSGTCLIADAARHVTRTTSSFAIEPPQDVDSTLRRTSDRQDAFAPNSSIGSLSGSTSETP